MVRHWVPRREYGKTWALLQSGLQTGGLVAYEAFGSMLATNSLRWQMPFQLSAVLSLGHALLCARVLRESAPSNELEQKRNALWSLITFSWARKSPPPPPPVVSGQAPRDKSSSWLSSSLRKFARKPQFWLMLVAVAAYTPIYEYGTFVTSYLRQLQPAGTLATPPPTPSLVGKHCIESRACAGRYGVYQLSYIVSLIAGSFVYDKCSQVLPPSSHSLRLALHGRHQCWCLAAERSAHLIAVLPLAAAVSDRRLATAASP
jgi:MFS family permease